MATRSHPVSRLLLSPSSFLYHFFHSPVLAIVFSSVGPLLVCLDFAPKPTQSRILGGVQSDRTTLIDEWARLVDRYSQLGLGPAEDLYVVIAVGCVGDVASNLELDFEFDVEPNPQHMWAVLGLQPRLKFEEVVDYLRNRVLLAAMLNTISTSRTIVLSANLITGSIDSEVVTSLHDGVMGAISDLGFSCIGEQMEILKAVSAVAGVFFLFGTLLSGNVYRTFREIILIWQPWNLYSLGFNLNLLVFMDPLIVFIVDNLLETYSSYLKGLILLV
ncbi:hypothetical protein Cni_G28734 [Canna indica]|uniref:Uncharacterized protein n=1 Tax=Canna indica TaxID=4628 RepID=A0AAQ3L309_9LILI|nr:hypothetical protein Cni_G28734 [Canna indica]